MYKYVPVDMYDLEAMECWLTEMGEKGFFPKGWDSSWICNFQKGEPKTVRYRLEPLTYSDEGRPDDEQLADYQAGGWRYIKTISKLYHIFAAERPDAVELHTDPIVQSYAMKGLVRRARGSLAVNFIWLTLLIILLVYSVSEGSAAMQLAEGGLFTAVVALIVLLASSVQETISAGRLLRLRKKLKAGDTMAHGGNFQRKSRWGTVLRVVALCIALAVFLFHWVRQFGGFEKEFGLEEYSGLQYPVLAALEGETYQPEDSFFGNGVNYFNFVRERQEDMTSVTEITQTGVGEGLRPRMETVFYTLRIGGWEEALESDLIQYFASHDEYRHEVSMFDPAAGQTVWNGAVRLTVFTEEQRVYVFAVCGRQVMALRYYGTQEPAKIAEAAAGAMAENAC